MKHVLLALIFAAALTAGPLTIQTQEAVWTNGLDTITLAPLTIEGPGTVTFASFNVAIADDPSARSLIFGTQAALLGDLETPIELNFVGVFNVTGTAYSFILSVPEQTFPHEDGDGLLVKIYSAGAFRSEDSIPTTFSGTLNSNIGVVVPEPSTYLFIGLGLMLLGWAHARNREVHDLDGMRVVELGRSGGRHLNHDGAGQI